MNNGGPINSAYHNDYQFPYTVQSSPYKLIIFGCIFTLAMVGIVVLVGASTIPLTGLVDIAIITLAALVAISVYAFWVSPVVTITCQDSGMDIQQGRSRRTIQYTDIQKVGYTYRKFRGWFKSPPVNKSTVDLLLRNNETYSIQVGALGIGKRGCLLDCIVSHAEGIDIGGNVLAILNKSPIFPVLGFSLSKVLAETNYSHFDHRE